MADLAEVYDSTRKEIAALVSDLDGSELQRRVPATPDWTIADVVAHLTGDVVCVAAGDFPREYFAAIGQEDAIVSLNDWTDGHVRERRGRPVQEVLAEWEKASAPILSMLAGTSEWPEGVLPFAGYILTTDIAIHQQDINGALGLKRDRDSTQVRVGTSTYINGVGLRLQMAGGPGLRFVVEDKEKIVGADEAAATVRAPRFELFRALSGRRSPEQIKGFDWEGDPEPFIPYFYPYGIRRDALAE